MPLEQARTWFERLLGLMGRATLPPGKMFLLPGCRRVHTWFMRFSIDVIFIDGEGRVIEILPAVAPWNVTPYIKNAAACIEMAANTAPTAGIRLGAKCIIDTY